MGLGCDAVFDDRGNVLAPTIGVCHDAVSPPEASDATLDVGLIATGGRSLKPPGEAAEGCVASAR
jgi:hypothetical protein